MLCLPKIRIRKPQPWGEGNSSDGSNSGSSHGSADSGYSTPFHLYASIIPFTAPTAGYKHKADDSVDNAHPSRWETEGDNGPIKIDGFPWDKINRRKPQCFVTRYLLTSSFLHANFINRRDDQRGRVLLLVHSPSLPPLRQPRRQV
jgi:hypothetical protein